MKVIKIRPKTIITTMSINEITRVLYCFLGFMFIIFN